MNNEICGTADIGRNFRSVVRPANIELDVSEFYGYTTHGLLKHVPGTIIYYKIHPATWIRFNHRHLWRLANILNNLARHLKIFHNISFLETQIRNSLDSNPNTHIGLHDWLSTRYITEVELRHFLKNRFGEKLHLLMICETQNGGYITVENYLQRRSSILSAHFGNERNDLQDSKKILSFKRYMNKRKNKGHHGC